MTDEPQDAPTPSPDPPRRRFSRIEFRALGRFFRLCLCAAAMVHPIARLVARWSWTADLISHFQVAALSVTLVALVASLRRARRTAAVLAVLALAQLWPIVRYSGPNPVGPDPGSSERLRILVTNVYYLSREYDDLAQLIRVERPDVIGIVEYSSFCRAWLEPIRAEYPYRIEYEDGPSGIALWSRRPLLTTGPVRWLGPDMNPIAHAVLEFAGKPRHLWVVHPTSPLWKGRRFLPGNRELTLIREEVRDTAGSRILVGDLNCTDGSPHFDDLLARTGLRDSRHGFGRQPSWPTDLFYKIPIDHALVSDDLAVVDRRLGPALWSDHYPLIVDLAPAAGAGRSVASQAADRGPAR